MIRARSRRSATRAKPIHARRRVEHGFTGGITIVTDDVREKKRRSKDVFVPLSPAPGHAQVDFGEMLGVIGGGAYTLHSFVMALPHSDAIFIKACPAETAEAFCDGHHAAFACFGGVPLSVLFDNTKIAVARICGDGTRERTRTFAELQSHFLFDDTFGPKDFSNGCSGRDSTTGMHPRRCAEDWQATSTPMSCGEASNARAATSSTATSAT